MAALRFSSPGQPTILVDLGPSVARVTHSRYGVKGSVGGMIVTPGTVSLKTNKDHQRKYREANQEHINAQRRDSRARVKARKA